MHVEPAQQLDARRECRQQELELRPTRVTEAATGLTVMEEPQARFPNITPANAEIAYMEAVMDWWMVYRGEHDLAALVGPPDGGPYMIRTYSVANGRIACLEITRGSAAAAA